MRSIKIILIGISLTIYSLVFIPFHIILSYVIGGLGAFLAICGYFFDDNNDPNK